MRKKMISLIVLWKNVFTWFRSAAVFRIFSAQIITNYYYFIIRRFIYIILVKCKKKQFFNQSMNFVFKQNLQNLNVSSYNSCFLLGNIDKKPKKCCVNSDKTFSVKFLVWFLIVIFRREIRFKDRVFLLVTTKI